jgi:hypothetical protein
MYLVGIDDADTSNMSFNEALSKLEEVRTHHIEDTRMGQLGSSPIRLIFSTKNEPALKRPRRHHSVKGKSKNTSEEKSRKIKRSKTKMSRQRTRKTGQANATEIHREKQDKRAKHKKHHIETKEALQHAQGGNLNPLDNSSNALAFVELFDSAKQRAYYKNVSTRKTTWKLPEGAVIVEDTKKKRRRKKREEKMLTALNSETGKGGVASASPNFNRQVIDETSNLVSKTSFQQGSDPRDEELKKAMAAAASAACMALEASRIANTSHLAAKAASANASKTREILSTETKRVNTKATPNMVSHLEKEGDVDVGGRYLNEFGLTKDIFRICLKHIFEEHDTSHLRHIETLVEKVGKGKEKSILKKLLKQYRVDTTEFGGLDSTIEAICNRAATEFVKNTEAKRNVQNFQEKKSHNLNEEKRVVRKMSAVPYSKLGKRTKSVGSIRSVSSASTSLSSTSDGLHSYSSVMTTESELRRRIEAAQERDHQLSI